MSETIISNTHNDAAWLDEVKWDHKGLVCAVAQEVFTHRVLMVAWMNREALEITATTGQATYFSRSRNKLWRKGEESGHTQTVRELRLDCDGDVILLKVEQTGGAACHTNRHSCFYKKLAADKIGTGSNFSEGKMEPVPILSWEVKEAPLA